MFHTCKLLSEQVSEGLFTLSDGCLPEKGPYTFTKCQKRVSDIGDTFHVRLELSISTAELVVDSVQAAMFGIQAGLLSQNIAIPRPCHTKLF